MTFGVRKMKALHDLVSVCNPRVVPTTYLSRIPRSRLLASGSCFGFSYWSPQHGNMLQPIPGSFGHALFRRQELSPPFKKSPLFLSMPIRVSLSGLADSYCKAPCRLLSTSLAAVFPSLLSNHVHPFRVSLMRCPVPSRSGCLHTRQLCRSTRGMRLNAVPKLVE